MTEDDEALLALYNSAWKSNTASGVRGIYPQSKSSMLHLPYRVCFGRKAVGSYKSLDEAKIALVEILKKVGWKEMYAEEKAKAKAKKLQKKALVKKMSEKMARTPTQLPIEKRPLLMRSEVPLFDKRHPGYITALEEFRKAIEKGQVVPWKVRQIINHQYSKYQGVDWWDKKDMWRAKFRGRVLGFFARQSDAARAYALAYYTYQDNPDNKEGPTEPSRQKGVTWQPSIGKWRVYRTINGRSKYLGSFYSYEEAVEAYAARHKKGFKAMDWQQRRIEAEQDEDARRALLDIVNKNEEAIEDALIKLGDLE